MKYFVRIYYQKKDIPNRNLRCFLKIHPQSNSNKIIFHLSTIHVFVLYLAFPHSRKSTNVLSLAILLHALTLFYATILFVNRDPLMYYGPLMHQGPFFVLYMESNYLTILLFPPFKI